MHTLNRFSRSLPDLIHTVGHLRSEDIGFRTLHENLDTTTPGGRLILHVFTAFSQSLRELIVEGSCQGLAGARARGPAVGRPPVMTPEKVVAAAAAPPQPDLGDRPPDRRFRRNDLRTPGRGSHSSRAGGRGST
ncbi:recombinase family protein [Salininema proteolyticum]|uniref:Recombinase family protein n=1 Tax=Salininema proteolyticum TaxID=1607685 RepID=A0ABV8U4F4_9ACTN